MDDNAPSDGSSSASPVVILASLVGLAVLLCAVLVIQSRNKESPAVVGSAAGPTSPSTTSTSVGPTTSSTAGTATTVTSGTPTSVAGATPTVPGVTPTDPPATPAPSTPTVPTPPPPSPTAACTPEQVEQTVMTNKTTYAAGEIVSATTTIRNRSASSCTVLDPDSGCYSLLAAFSPSDARPFWRSGSAPAAGCGATPRRTLIPSQSASYGAAWDQLDRRDCGGFAFGSGCPSPARVPGPYTIRTAWMAPSATTGITLA